MVFKLYETGLRIRIHFIRIWIQHFRRNTNPDLGLYWPKIGKKLLLKKKFNFFLSKTAINLSLGLHKVRPSYRRSLQLSKEAIQHFKTWTFKFIFALLDPDPDSESGSRSTDPIESGSNPDPDPQPCYEIWSGFQGCSSRIPDPDPYFLPIPDPGSRGQKGTGSLIRIRNSGTISTKKGWRV